MERRVTTQDISWFLDLDGNGQLDLDPSYQRRSVWSPKDRRFFLDTIFRGYPSPSIFLHKELGENGKHIHHVVDGKQRLQTILKFVNNELAIDKHFGDSLLDGKKWKHLDNDTKRKFWDYVIPVEFIKIVEGTVVNEVFDRLNRYSRNLTAQELRHAKYDGWFIGVAEHESEEQFWKDVGVVTTSRAKRMRDVQFISELLMVLLENDISGFDQDAIDSVYAKYENPAETDEAFNVDDFQRRLDRVKHFVRNMEEHNASVTRHCSTFVNFYTLWSVIAVNIDTIKSPDQAAERYNRFMEKVNELKQADLQTLTEQDAADEELRLAFIYHENARGANTEPVQREQRHKVLCQILVTEVQE